MKYNRLSLSLAGLLLAATPLHAAEPGGSAPTVEELWKIIQQQQAEIEALKRQQQSTEQKVADVDEKAEAAVEAVEEVGTAGAGSWADKTTIGGYGEMHYNNTDSKEEIDFHRWIQFELDRQHHAAAGQKRPGTRRGQQRQPGARTQTVGEAC